MTKHAEAAQPNLRIAEVDLNHLPNTSIARLYDPERRANSFALDGFPKLKPGKSWQDCLVDIIEHAGALDMTTNQTLLRQLIESGALDGRISELAGAGKTVDEIYGLLYTESAQEAAQIFSEINNTWPCEGRVSQEASALISDLEPLVSAAENIHKGFVRGGGFTKVPNLKVGPEAVRRATRAGVSVNVTLVFSIRHYLDTAAGFINGLSERVADLRKQGASDSNIQNDISSIYSVNSLFVSRLDRVLDPMIDQRSSELKAAEGAFLKGLRGKTAVAHAKIIYRIFEAVFLGKPFQNPEQVVSVQDCALIEALSASFNDLKPYGANPQRLLIASTGVKGDQPYHPLLYVLPFLGPYVHNTLPEGTLEQLSVFVASCDGQTLERIKKRSFISEPLPALAQLDSNKDVWLARMLKPSAAESISPDAILKKVISKVLTPKSKTLTQICDDLRDQGAKAFEQDERATLEVIRQRVNQINE